MNPVILFDGACGLCDRSVRFVLKRDARGLFRFQSLQAPGVMDWVRGRLGGPPPDSLVVVDGDGIHFRGEAALRVARALGLPWSALAALGRLVPRRCRDAAYDAVARRRLRWFGAPDAACPLTASLPAERLWVPPG